MPLLLISSCRIAYTIAQFLSEDIGPRSTVFRKDYFYLAQCGSRPSLRAQKACGCQNRGAQTWYSTSGSTPLPVSCFCPSLRQ